ncbi:MAG: hypothetical protein AAFQ98_25025, partial [Bacteroidota bacterium]
MEHQPIPAPHRPATQLATRQPAYQSTHPKASTPASHARLAQLQQFQALANSSPHTTQRKALQHLANQSPQALQLKAFQSQSRTAVQRVAINDDPALEQEADVMGAKAASLGTQLTTQRKPDSTPGHPEHREGLSTEFQRRRKLGRMIHSKPNPRLTA